MRDVWLGIRCMPMLCGAPRQLLFSLKFKQQKKRHHHGKGYERDLCVNPTVKKDAKANFGIASMASNIVMPRHYFAVYCVAAEIHRNEDECDEIEQSYRD